MTPKEKAEQLLYYYMPFCSNNYNDAKQCALIAVDEIIKTFCIPVTFSSKEYWEKVKQEIEKL